MIKNNVKENLFDDEENIYVGLSDLVNLRESAELREAANAFESYLVNYAQVAHMPQSVLSDICRLSVEAAHRGMEFCFMKGFELGCRVMRSALEGELEADDCAETDENCGLEGCAAMGEDCLADDLALDDLPVDVTDKNRIAGLSAELMAQAEQYAVELGIQAYLEFTRTLTPEMRVGLEGHKDNGVPET